MGQFADTPLSIPRAKTRVPKSKEDVLNSLQVMVPEAQLKRIKNHVAEIFFPDTGATFLLTIHKPRGPKSPVAGAAADAANKKAAQGKRVAKRSSRSARAH